MSHWQCVMGCVRVPGQTLHTFPRDSQRRAKWCRILGVYPRTKIVMICNAHFSNFYFNGLRLSKFALPNPPDSRVLTNLMNAMKNGKSNYKTPKEDVLFSLPAISANYMSKLFHDNSSSSFPETEIRLSETETECNNLQKDTVEEMNNFPTTSEDENKKETPQETFSNVESFEIRKGTNNDMIIKGRYIQTNDYLVVSYTPPRKWSLQEQVKTLDKTCTQQLIKIREQNKEINRLSMELKKYEKLLPKLRFLQTRNRFIYAQLKMYEIHEKNRRKRIKEKKLKNNKGSSLE